MDIFSSPQLVSAYLERLDATTLPFAVDAAYILELVPPHQGREYVVLDDACGTGAALEWIVREFNEKGVRFEIYATDHSAVMINEVENRRDRLGWGINVKCFLMDAKALTFPTNTFTHVFMNFGIMLIPNYKAALKSIFRVLRRDGHVAIVTWKRQGHWDYLTRAARLVLGDKSYPPPTFFDPKWLSGRYIAKLLAIVGFRDVEVHERTHMWRWNSKTAFIDFVGRSKAPSIQAYSHHWSVGQKDDVTNTIKLLLDHDFPDANNFSVPMTAHIVVGRKL